MWVVWYGWGGVFLNFAFYAVFKILTTEVMKSSIFWEQCYVVCWKSTDISEEHSWLSTNYIALYPSKTILCLLSSSMYLFKLTFQRNRTGFQLTMLHYIPAELFFAVYVPLCIYLNTKDCINVHNILCQLPYFQAADSLDFPVVLSLTSIPLI
jgi:hypothetical protein